MRSSGFFLLYPIIIPLNMMYNKSFKIIRLFFRIYSHKRLPIILIDSSHFVGRKTILSITYTAIIDDCKLVLVNEDRVTSQSKESSFVMIPEPSRPGAHSFIAKPIVDQH